MVDLQMPLEFRGIMNSYLLSKFSCWSQDQNLHENKTHNEKLKKRPPMTRQCMHHSHMRCANKYTLTKCRTERLHQTFLPITSLALNNL